MIKGVIIKKLEKQSDRRGWLAEIYRSDEINHQPAMSYVSITKPGVARGPHEHKFQSDCFVFIGQGIYDLYLWDRRKNSKTNGQQMKIKAYENEPVMIIVPPGIVHGYKCVSNHDGLCINLPDKLYKGEGKKGEIDEIRWEDKSDSPYKIV